MKRQAARFLGYMGFIVLGVCIAPFSVADDVRATLHNLGSNSFLPSAASGKGAPNSFDGTEEICIFCHTPHGGDVSAAVPLWNRVLNNPDSYITYDQLGTSTLDGAVARVGSVSIACLSCHDGTQAMDTVINAPGSGGHDPNGNRMEGNWVGADQEGGMLKPGLIANIGLDLTNDHPVSIQYAGGGVSASSPTPAQGQTTDPDFNIVSHRQTLDGRHLWWIDSNPNGRRDMLGDVVLYTRSGTEGYVGQTEEEPFVECASCHNPHAAENGTFLRISNSGSALCLTCHAK